MITLKADFFFMSNSNFCMLHGFIDIFTTTDRGENIFVKKINKIFLKSMKSLGLSHLKAIHTFT